MSALKFGRGKFEVQINGVKQTVEGQICDDFGVYKAGFLKWRIVHLHTAQHFPMLEGANAKTVKARIEALYEICNWNHYSAADIDNNSGKSVEEWQDAMASVEAIVIGG